MKLFGVIVLENDTCGAHAWVCQGTQPFCQNQMMIFLLVSLKNIIDLTNKELNSQQFKTKQITKKKDILRCFIAKSFISLWMNLNN